MRTSVIVPTYQAPRELDLCLAGLSRQTTPPDEIFVADDGSGDDTRAIASYWKERMSSPLVHVWHPDEGNRKARICNQAVRESTGDLLIFIDGDSIPHSRWISDHLQAAPRAPVCCGRRVKLGPRLSPAITRQAVLEGTLEKLGGPVTWSALRGDTRRYHFGLRLPSLLARALRPRPKNLMGVNFSVHRTAFFAVNGYDEQWNHRRQDKDLDLRLSRGGFAYTPLLYRGIVYHLHHPERLPSETAERRVEQESRSGRVRCEVGLSDDRR